MKTCLRCNAELPAFALRCVYCGAEHAARDASAVAAPAGVTGDSGAAAVLEPVHRPGTEQVEPLSPHLATHVSRSMVAEPWGEPLETVMLVLGLLLLACFVAPWSVGETTAFSWTVLGSGAATTVKLVPLMLAGAGILAVIFGVLPLSTLARGFAAIGLGGAPLLFGMLSQRPPAVQSLVLMAGTIAIASGLLLRSRYSETLMPRIVVSVGAATVLAMFLVPADGAVLGVLAEARAIPAPGGRGGGSAAAIGLVRPLLVLVALLVWLPSPSPSGLHVLAWVHLLWTVAASVLLVLFAADPAAATFPSDLAGTVYLPFATCAWLALVSYGVAAVAGQQLEPP